MMRYAIANMMRYAVAVILLCIAAALAFSMRKNKNNPDSIYAKSLLRVKSVQILPVISLVYAFYVTVVAFLGLLAVDYALDYEQLMWEETVVSHMCHNRSNDDKGYPLVSIRGRQPDVGSDAANIVVVGDSFVWGYGTTNMNQIWWNHLEDELARRGYNCKVYAVGRSGASTYDEMLWLRDTPMLKDLQPDLIILGYFINDPDLESIGMGLKCYGSALFGNFREKQSPLKAPLPNLYYYFDLKMHEKHSRTENPRNNGETGYTSITVIREYAQSPNIDNYDAYVVRPLGAFVQELDFPMIVIPTPPHVLRYDFTSQQKVMPLFERAGLPVYDPYEPFLQGYLNAKNRNFMMTSPVNAHFGPAASLFMGKYAADVLERDYAAVLGPKAAWDTSSLCVEINDWLPHMLEPRATQESSEVSQYIFQYPDQRDVFLSYAVATKIKEHVKLNFKYPVKLSSIQIEGADLLSAKVYTLGLNLDLGFDDQKPVSLGYRRGSSCTWKDTSERYVASLLISAKTKDGRQAPLTITIESDGGEEAFY